MGSKAVLDASAILAVLLGEPGSERLTDELLADAVVSTVNLAEVQSKLVRDGHPVESAWESIQVIAPVAEPFTATQAQIAGSLIERTRARGLSLGDRSCLALAIDLSASVYTTEQVWRGLDIGVPIHVIR